VASHKRGFYFLISAQFASALADNAMLLLVMRYCKLKGKRLSGYR
jgi:hypothetical protein